MNIGIHDLDVATTHYVLDLDEMAAALGIDPAKYAKGLGQDEFSVPAPDEDVVTMAAEAAARVMSRNDASKLRMVLFATETGIDQSKAAGVFVHGLLGLPSAVRNVEFKQACYSGTAALQSAVNHVARFPEDEVLVITSDVARYAVDSGGEPTQGAGAVAMLIAADPNLVVIEPGSGVFTEDVNDFWRPNDSSTPYVEGKLSLDAYLDATIGAWDDLVARRDIKVTDIDRFMHHQPFTKMARKAHTKLAEHVGAPLGPELIEESMAYNRRLGNSYTASLYFGLVAQLHSNDDLAGKRLGLLSYGSGSVAEFFTAVVQPGYTEHLHPDNVVESLDRRVSLTFDEYRDLHASYIEASNNVEIPAVTSGPYRYTGIIDRVRQYEAK